MHIFVIKFQSKKPLSSVYNQSATTITFLKSLKVSSWQGWVGKAKIHVYAVQHPGPSLAQHLLPTES